MSGYSVDGNDASGYYVTDPYGHVIDFFAERGQREADACHQLYARASGKPAS